MPHTSNIYQLRQFTQDYGHTHPQLVLKLCIHLSNCSSTTLPYLRSYSPFQYPLSPALAAQYQSGRLCGPMDCSPLGSSVHGYSSGKNTGLDCHALLQGVFPTQGSSPGLPHCRRILYCLSCQGSPAPSNPSPKHYSSFFLSFFLSIIILFSLDSPALDHNPSQMIRRFPGSSAEAVEIGRAHV